MVPKYGTKTQYEEIKEKNPILSKKVIMELQKIIGALFFNARMVESTIMVELNDPAY